jgi:hypothetical protein
MMLRALTGPTGRLNVSALLRAWLLIGRSGSISSVLVHRVDRQNGLRHGEHNEAMLRFRHASIIPFDEIDPSWVCVNVFLSTSGRRET